MLITKEAKMVSWYYSVTPDICLVFPFVMQMWLKLLIVLSKRHPSKMVIWNKLIASHWLDKKPGHLPQLRLLTIRDLGWFQGLTLWAVCIIFLCFKFLLCAKFINKDWAQETPIPHLLAQLKQNPGP